MNTVFLPRLGAACGAAFAIVLFVASGSGSGTFHTSRAIAGLAALALFVPFAAYLSSLVRSAEGEHGWLGSTALAAGIVGITLKIVSVVPALALHNAGVAESSPAHKVLDAFDDGATVISLYPLAIFCAAIAIAAYRTRVLPRWLAAAAGVTAAALAANGSFLAASFVPALLLFVAWTLAASVYLFRRARSVARAIEPATATA